MGEALVVALALLSYFAGCGAFFALMVWSMNKWERD